MAKKNVFQKKNINPGEYVNSKTGELLSSEIEGVTSVNVLNQDLQLISSREYVIVDAVALEYMSKNFNNADLANVLKMSNMVDGEYNALYDEFKNPHTTQTLQKELDYSVNKFRDFLNRLFRGGVISYFISYKNNQTCKFIILNPYLARKRKTFSPDTLKLFNNFEITEFVTTKDKKK